MGRLTAHLQKTQLAEVRTLRDNLAQFRAMIANKAGLTEDDLSLSERFEITRAWRSARRILKRFDNDISHQLTPEDLVNPRKSLLDATQTRNVVHYINQWITKKQDASVEIQNPSSDVLKVVETVLPALSEDEYRQVMSGPRLDVTIENPISRVPETQKVLVAEAKAIQAQQAALSGTLVNTGAPFYSAYTESGDISQVAHVAIPRDRAVRLMQIFEDKELSLRLSPEHARAQAARFHWPWQWRQRSLFDVVGPGSEITAENVAEYVDEHAPQLGEALEVPLWLWQKLTESEKDKVLGQSSFETTSRYQRRSVRVENVAELTTEQLTRLKARLQDTENKLKALNSAQTMLDKLSIAEAKVISSARYSRIQRADEAGLAHMKFTKNAVNDVYQAIDHLYKGAASTAAGIALGGGLTTSYVLGISVMSANMAYDGLRNARLKETMLARGMLKLHRTQEQMILESVTLALGTEQQPGLIRQLDDAHELKRAMLSWLEGRQQATIKEKFAAMMIFLREHQSSLDPEAVDQKFLLDFLSAYEKRPSVPYDRSERQLPLKSFMANLMVSLNAAGFAALVMLKLIPLFLAVPIAGWIVAAVVAASFLVALAVTFAISRWRNKQSAASAKRTAKLGVRQSVYNKMRALVSQHKTAKRASAAQESHAQINTEEIEVALSRTYLDSGVANPTGAENPFLVRTDNPAMAAYLLGLRMADFRAEAQGSTQLLSIENFRAKIIAARRLRGLSPSEQKEVDAAWRRAQTYQTYLLQNVIPNMPVDSRILGGELPDEARLSTWKEQLNKILHTDYYEVSGMRSVIAELTPLLTEEDYRHVFATDEIIQFEADSVEQVDDQGQSHTYLKIPRDRAVRFMALLAKKGLIFELDEVRLAALGQTPNSLLRRKARTLEEVLDEGGVNASNVIELIDEHEVLGARRAHLLIPKSLWTDAGFTEAEQHAILGPRSERTTYTYRREDLRDLVASATEAELKAQAARLYAVLNNKKFKLRRSDADIVGAFTLQEAQMISQARYSASASFVAESDPGIKIGVWAITPIAVFVIPLIVGGAIALTTAAVITSLILPVLFVAFMAGLVAYRNVNARRNARAAQTKLAVALCELRSDKLKIGLELEKLVLALAEGQALREAYRAWLAVHQQADSAMRYDAIMRLAQACRNSLDKDGSIDNLLLRAIRLNQLSANPATVTRSQSKFKMFISCMDLGLLMAGTAGTIVGVLIPALLPALVLGAPVVIAAIVGGFLLGMLIKYAFQRRAQKQQLRTERRAARIESQKASVAQVTALVKEQSKTATARAGRAREAALIRRVEVDAAEKLHDASNRLYDLFYKTLQRMQQHGTQHTHLDATMGKHWQDVLEAGEVLSEHEKHASLVAELRQVEGALAACCIKADGEPHKHQPQAADDVESAHHLRSAVDDKPAAARQPAKTSLSERKQAADSVLPQAKKHRARLPSKISRAHLEEVVGLFAKANQKAAETVEDVRPKKGRLDASRPMQSSGPKPH